MTTEERLEKVERELGATRRRSRWLLVGLALGLGALALVWTLAASVPKAEAQGAVGGRTVRANVPVIPTPGFSQVPAEPVARIIDGDTITVVRGGQEVKVRLIGVDTPETVHPSKPVEAYGKEASRFTTNLLKGERVYLVRDPTSAKTFDRYGRLLAFVYRAPDGLFVNAEIIRQGYGYAYVQYPFRYMEEFRALERFAREAGKGLWEPPRPRICPDCNGAGRLITPSGAKRCGSCNGTGKVTPTQLRICPVCKGSGRISTTGPLIRMTLPCPACTRDRQR